MLLVYIDLSICQLFITVMSIGSKYNDFDICIMNFINKPMFFCYFA